MVHENVVRRAINLKTGEEEIEVLDAGELAVKSFSRSPVPNRTVVSGNRPITTDSRGRVSAKKRHRRTKRHPYWRNGQ